jgi:ZIP family zinc transporter
MDPVIWIVIIAVSGPVLGSVIGVLKMPTFGYICNMLCFAAGVMLAVSFIDLIPESQALSSPWISVSGVVLGSMVMYGLDRIIPHIHPRLCAQEQGCNLERTSVYLILGMFLHNFPEGMAIAIGSVTEMKVSITIALAIAIHNIPEGICTSAPYYHSTGKRMRAFLLSSATAVPVLVGYITARTIFQQVSPQVVGLLISATAGLMIYITADELIPHSCAGSNHQTIFSLMLGVVFVILLGGM